MVLHGLCGRHSVNSNFAATAHIIGGKWLAGSDKT